MKPILCVAFSAVCYGMQPSLISLVYANGGNSFSTAFGLCALGAVLLGLVVCRQKKSLRISGKLFVKLLILDTFGGTATSLLLYYSYARISSGLSTTLHYVYPIVVALLLAIFCHEKLTLRKGMALGMAVCGIVLISGIESDSMDFIGVAAAVASGCCWGFYIVYMDKSGIAAQDSYVMSFYLALISVPECGLAALLTHSCQPLAFPKGWLYLLAVAIISRLLAGPLFQKGISGTGSMIAGVLSTLEPITAMLLSLALTGERLTLGKWMGAVLVLGGACLIALQTKPVQKKERAEISTQNGADDSNQR